MATTGAAQRLRLTQRTQRHRGHRGVFCRAGPSIPQGERAWVKRPQRAESRPSTTKLVSWFAARATRSGATDMSAFAFDPVTLPAATAALRAEVRAFLRDELGDGTPAERRANSWSVFDAAFSRKLARRGWIGMTWPRR